MKNIVEDDAKRIADNLLTLREHKGDTRKNLLINWMAILMIQ